MKVGLFQISVFVFKKDPSITVNKNKQEILKKCMGDVKTNVSNDTHNVEGNIQILGEKLYILQDTNKIQDGRLGLLPTYLDFYFNIMMDRDKYIKQQTKQKIKWG